MTKAVFLIDGGPKIGLGHLRRSQRLMEAMAQRNVDCQLFLPDDMLSFRDDAKSWPGDLATLPAADIIVADSYRLPPDKVATWSRQYRLRVIVDDLADRILPAEVVINHNVNADELDYSAWKASRVLAGLSWSLVDPSFIAARDRRTAKSLNTILISFGGVAGDHGVETARAILTLAPDCMIHLVVPPKAAMPTWEHPNLTLLQAPDMATAMSDASIYVGAGGVTALEASAAGMALAVCCLYDNQIGVITRLRNMGLQAFPQYDPAQLAAAAAQILASPRRDNPLTEAFDGQGADRAADAILTMRA